MNNLENMSDKQLDEVFREASENNDAFQNQWDQMKERLEKEAPKPSVWSRHSNLLLALLFLLPITVFYLTKNSKSRGSFKEVVVDKNANIGANKKREVGSQILKNRIKVKEPKRDETDEFGIMKVGLKMKKKESKSGFEHTISKSSSSVYQSKLSKKVKIENVHPTIVLEKNTSIEVEAPSFIVHSNRKDLLTNEDKSHRITQQQQKVLNADERKYLRRANMQEGVKDLQRGKDLTEALSYSKMEDTVAERTKIFTQSINELEGSFGPIPISEKVQLDSSLSLPKLASKPADNYFKKGFFVQIGISPELSIVSEFDKETPIGNNQAFLLNYRFSRNWSIQSGYVKSLKYYSAYPADYKWVWKNVNTPLREIDAVCKMIDIPLNVRFDFKSKVRSKYFASTGITSYLMKKETYNYLYENDADPSIKWRQWNGKTGFYKAGVLNFSAGVEYKLTKKLSFQIEPFAKIPMKQIGFGKVKLSTYGVLFSAIYPLNVISKN